MDYAAFKASLGIKPTQLDTGFQDCHTAHVAEHVPDFINRRASSSARKTLARHGRSLFRGHLLIHASKSYDEAGRRWMRKELGIQAPEEGDCPQGGIIGSVFLVACVRDWRSPWYGGPFGFVLERPYPLPFCPCRGQLQLFEVPT